MTDPTDRRNFLKIAGASLGKPGSTPRPGIEEVELTLREFSGTVGIQQLLKAGVTS